MSPQPAGPRFTLLCENWQVGGGMLGEPAVSDVLTSAVELVPLSDPRLAPSSDLSSVSSQWSRDNQYRVTAHVLQLGSAQSATVLDLGDVRVQRREWGRAALGVDEGTTVALDVSLHLDPFLDAPWIVDAHERFGVLHRWRIEGIVAVGTGVGERRSVERASAEAVSDRGYCLFDCTLLDGHQE